MTRLSAVTPSGHLTLGNYLGAIKHWAELSQSGYGDDLYFVSDLHAMTTAHNPAKLRTLSREALAILIASGISPETLFVQSDIIRELGALTWILESTANFGETSRMIQFKEKAKAQASVRVSLFTYPILMAADILLQGASEVPVGEDQRQHVELTRALAQRFNAAYGEVFIVPRAVLPTIGARIRDLAEPQRKMDKSRHGSPGVIFLLDEPDLIRRKIQRSVTDSLSTIEYDPENRLGLANLLEILAICTDNDPATVAEHYNSYATLKDAVTEAVIDTLQPIRKDTLSLLDDRAELDRVRRTGAQRATERGAHRLNSALRLVGAG